MNLGERVRAARRHAKLTQVQLAEAVGVRQQTLSDLERGENDGSAKLAEIAIECGVSARWLARGTGSMLDVENVIRVEEPEPDYPDLDPERVAVTFRALTIVLKRRGREPDLTTIEGASLFAKAYALAGSMGDDEIGAGAAIADLVSERERRGIEDEPLGAVARGKAREGTGRG